MYKLGIDIGSRNTKIVIFNPVSGSLLHSAYQATDISPRKSVSELLNKAYEIFSLKPQDIFAIGVTGYGRKLYPEANSILSEITCHAAGCLYHFPQTRTVIDIGGQDSKIISIDTHGKVADFVMNDKCAAGTGRFLEMTAIRLGCEIEALANLASQSSTKLKLSSTCVVFAESEIIGMMASATSASDIARSVHQSVALRIASQMAALAWAIPSSVV